MAALHPRTTWKARPFLAVRRVGHPGGALGHRRGLSDPVEPELRQRGPNRRPTRRLHDRRLAFARRPRWPPRGIPEARTIAARTHIATRRGLDIGRYRLDPGRQRAR